MRTNSLQSTLRQQKKGHPNTGEAYITNPVRNQIGKEVQVAGHQEVGNIPNFRYCITLQHFNRDSDEDDLGLAAEELALPAKIEQEKRGKTNKPDGAGEPGSQPTYPPPLRQRYGKEKKSSQFCPKKDPSLKSFVFFILEKNKC